MLMLSLQPSNLFFNPPHIQRIFAVLLHDIHHRKDIRIRRVAPALVAGGEDETAALAGIPSR